MKVLVLPLAVLLLGGMSYGGYSNYKRMWAEEKLIDSWMAEMTDDKVAGIEILFDYCKIQPMPTLGKAVAKYKATHGQSLEKAKFKAREELIRNPFFGMVKNMCPLFQQQMDAIQQQLMDALQRKLDAG